MNYIKHLNKAFEIMFTDPNLTPFHVSLYMALFLEWNNNRFKNPILFNRNELMQVARIGSFTTYTKTIRELHEWKYIRYIPGEKRGGTLVYMYTMCTPECTSNCTDKCTCSRTHAVHQSVHISDDTLYIDNKDNKDKECKGKSTPSHEEISKFFLENKSEVIEADKFFFHYQANGWMTGKNHPIVDWKASAQKWILNTSNFNNSYGKRTKDNRPTAGHLHAGNNKDYSEPL